MPGPVEAPLHLRHQPVPVPPQRPSSIGDRVMGVAVDDLELRLGNVEVDPADADRRRPEVDGRDSGRHQCSDSPTTARIAEVPTNQAHNGLLGRHFGYRPVASVVEPRSSTIARR